MLDWYLKHGMSCKILQMKKRLSILRLKSSNLILSLILRGEKKLNTSPNKFGDVLFKLIKT